MFDDLLINIKVNKDGVKDGISGVSKALNGLKGSMSGINQVIGGAKLYMLADAMAKCVTSTMEMTETVNLFNVSMGEMAVQTNDTLSQLSEVSGLDLTNLQNATGTFGLLARSMGLSSTQSNILSTNTSQLAIDLSSLTNVPIARVMQDLRSGLLGQSETVYKYGMDVTEAGLKTEAMAQGISKSVRDMSQGEKMALRYSTMIRQSGLAQGDFAKTIETPANQLRILSERFVTLGRVIGSVFMSAIGGALPYLNAFVSILIDVFTALGKFFGFEAPVIENTTKTATGGIDGIGDSLADTTGKAGKTTKALKDMKNATMGFDEINVLPKQPTDTPDSGSGGAGGGGGGSLLGDFDMPSYDSMISGIKQRSDEIKANLLNMISSIGNGFMALGSMISEPIINAMDIMMPYMVGFIDVMKDIFADLGTLGQPLVEWINTQLLPLVDIIITSFALTFAGVLDSANMIFSSLWNEVIFPILENFVLVGLPIVTEFATQCVNTFNVWFREIKSIFDMLWREAVEPILKFITKLWLDMMDILSSAWNTYGIPIFNSIREYFMKMGEIWRLVWNEFLKPIFETFMEQLDWLWTKHLKPLVERFVEFVAEIVKCGLDILNKFILPLVKWFIEKFGKPIAEVFQFIISVFGSWIGGIMDIAGAIIRIFTGIIQFITGVFTGNWRQAWNGVKNIFGGIMDGLGAMIKLPLNYIIDAINAMIRGLNNIEIPEWVPVVGGMSLDIPRIPKLARGGMVDGGGLFQAGENGKAEMIGGYQGKTTVMPLENTGFVNAIQDAVFTAVKSAMPTPQATNENNGDVILQVGNTEFGRIAINSINKITQQEGRLALNI